MKRAIIAHGVSAVVAAKHIAEHDGDVQVLRIDHEVDISPYAHHEASGVIEVMSARQRRQRSKTKSKKRKTFKP